MTAQRKMVPCPNCEGEGFLADAGSVGLTTPCPVCLTEGVVPEQDAVDRPKGAVPRKGPPKSPDHRAPNGG